MQKRAWGHFRQEKAVTHAWSPAGKVVILDETTGEIHNVIGLRGLRESTGKTDRLYGSRRISCQAKHSIDCGEARSVSLFFRRAGALRFDRSLHHEDTKIHLVLACVNLRVFAPLW